MTGGTAVGLGAGDWLFRGQDTSSQLLEVKNIEISKLKDQLDRSDLELLAKQEEYSQILEEVDQKIRDMQLSQSSFDSDKRTLEQQIKQQTQELQKVSQTLKGIDIQKIEAQIKGIENQLQEKENKVARAKSEKDAIEQINKDGRLENGNLQKEKGDLQEKLKKLNYLERVFVELRGVGIKKEEIKNLDTYWAHLNNAIRRRQKTIGTKSASIMSSLNNLRSQLFGRSVVRRSSSPTIIGSSEQEAKFLEELQKILDKI
ncbi:hypothetical protein OVS_03980 [Mycoplasma ovis str. Michigan]|uniref:Uncharacterized protein n=1 Tax=Mycoplasma ovis str. Michigan TaxID=1415773 RepID=A0ABN4BNS7_9MOLU|nr:hypothetical protein OVS_03980 [Mycoplasma ovis str. Michigan]